MVQDKSQNKEIRNMVSKFYSKAVNRPSSEGRCSGDSAVPKGVAAKLAGYSQAELNALPGDAVVNSFGCGNPLAFSEVREGDVVVDLGSGAGIDILLAAKKVGPQGKAIGIDMTDDMLARARENIEAAGLNNVEVRKGVIEKMPLDDNSVDWVISNCVINLSPDKPSVFREIFRVLKPGGRMSVSDIMVQDIPDWLRRDKQLYGSCIAGAIGEADYLAGLKQAGLVDVEVRERLQYDNAQLRSTVQSEVSEEQSGCCNCSCGEREEKDTERYVEALSGNVWSAKVFARKPGP